MPTSLQPLKLHWPLVLVFLVCGLFFIVDMASGRDGRSVTDSLMMVPYEVSAGWEALLAREAGRADLHALATTFTYALLHADVEHLLMNMVFIWLFGSLVLRELGPAWFFIIFVLTAITGALGQVLLDPGSPIPTLGASGALMGLEGAYLAMALRWRLPQPDIWPLSRPIPQERLIIFAAIGIAMDVSGIVGQDGGIAFGAHIGGFLGGAALASSLIPRPRNAL